MQLRVKCFNGYIFVPLQRQKRLFRKREERKMYVQLYDAMEALVHIYRDGCMTIGPHDKAPKKDKHPCGYTACKGTELLVRHYASCKLRVPGGCAHCKRIWQLLELHSRLCIDSTTCRVPLCRYLDNLLPFYLLHTPRFCTNWLLYNKHKWDSVFRTS